MPTYQYKCKACENRFDVMQRITEDPLTDCPECGGEIRRVLFPAGVVFKGSGWYVTDYRSASEKARYEAETKGTTATDGKAADKPSESKAGDKPAESKPEGASSESGTASPAAAVKPSESSGKVAKAA